MLAGADHPCRELLRSNRRRQPPFAWRQGLRGGPPTARARCCGLGRKGSRRRRVHSPPRLRILGDIVDRVLRDELSAPTRFSASGCGTASGSWTAPKSFRSTSLGSSTSRCGIWPGASQAADLAAPGRIPPVHPGVRLDGDIRHARGVPRRDHQCLELGYPAIKLHAWGDAARTRGSASPFASTSAPTSP